MARFFARARFFILPGFICVTRVRKFDFCQLGIFSLIKFSQNSFKILARYIKVHFQNRIEFCTCEKTWKDMKIYLKVLGTETGDSTPSLVLHLETANG